jgi:hypothetical protein
MSAKPVDHAGFLSRLNAETPRSRILLATGFLEEVLRTAILKRLAKNKASNELFGETATLSLTLLAKYARAFGLIGESELIALKKLAKVRNEFAHSWHADFSDNNIQKISDSIQFIRLENERDMPDHQRCFSRLDYLGVFLLEEFSNRFAAIPETIYDGGVFAKRLVVDPVKGNHSFEVETP